MEEKKKISFRLGIVVLLILAVLTVVEFVVATINIPWIWILYVIALVKAWFVIKHYMHFPRLFTEEESH
jgi:undecaprenyl pyrophosphate phosphatase UppP